MRKGLLLVLLGMFLQGCSTLSAGKHTLGSLSEVQLAMDKQAVEKVLGKPDVVRMGKKLGDGTVYELHEYKLYSDFSVTALSFALVIPAQLVLGTETYWLHYVNSKLVFWGDEGNWRGMPKWFSSTYAAPSTEATTGEVKPPSLSSPIESN